MRMLPSIFTALSLASAAVMAAGPASAIPAAPLAVSQPDPIVAVQWGRHWRGGAVGVPRVGRPWAGAGVGRGWARPGVGVWPGRRIYGYGYRRPYYGGYGYGYGYPAYGYGYGYPYGYGYGYPVYGYPYGYGWGYDPGAAAAAGIIGLATGAIVSNALRAPRYTRYASSAVRYCAQRYRSYDPVSRTFRGRDGRRHRCG